MNERLLHLEGTVDGQAVSVALGPGRHVVGRARECAVCLPNPSVSRRHAEIVIDAGGAVVRDLGSRNGTRVNGAAVALPSPLAAGDRLGIADLELQVQAAPGAARPAGASAAAPLTMADLADPALQTAGEELSWEEILDLRRSGTSAAATVAGAERHARLFQVLAEAGDLLTVPRDPGELYEPILDLVESALSPDRTLLLLYEDEGDEPVVRASRLRGRQPRERLALSRTMIERVLREKTSFLTGDAMLDPRFQAQQSIIAQGIRCAMAAPLFDNERVIGLLYADCADLSRRYGRDELRAFTLLANVVAVAISHARYHVLEEEKRRLDAELGAARAILLRLLPDAPADCPGYELAAVQEPCHEVGGDLYDTVPLPDGRLALVMGDVAGKGLGAALLVSSLMPALHLLLEESLEPAPLIQRLNRQLFRTTDAERFVTLFLGLLDPVSGRVAYVNAGHSPPLVIAADGQGRALPPTGLPVGAFEDIPFKAGEVTLAPGDLLALYSDGVTEATAAGDADDEYGTPRLQELLQRERARPAADIVASVRADLARFSGDVPAADDITLVVVRRR